MPSEVLALLLIVQLAEAFISVWEAVMPMIAALLITLIVMLASALFVRFVSK